MKTSIIPILSESDVKRFFKKVAKTAQGCWVWTSAKNPSGYGNFHLKRKTFSAHRVSFVYAHGEIQPGLTLDHKCKNTSCVNPDHLEPVTLKANIRRTSRYNRSHCKNGHKMTLENIIALSKGGRLCRECNRLSCLKKYQRKKKNERRN